jgi:hypothetical protein
MAKGGYRRFIRCTICCPLTMAGRGNLVLIDNDPDHTLITRYQIEQTKGCRLVRHGSWIRVARR